MLIHSCTKIASELLFHAISQLSFRFMRIQAFPRELVDDVQHAIFPPIVSAIFDEGRIGTNIAEFAESHYAKRIHFVILLQHEEHLHLIDGGRSAPDEKASLGYSLFSA